MKRSVIPASIADRVLLAVSLLALTLWGVGNQPAVAEDSLAIRCAETERRIGVERTRPGTTVAKGIEGQVAAAPQGSPGLRVYVDPLTGEFSAPPPWAARPDEALAPQAAFSTSEEGLVETPSPVPGGGVVVNLRGRFRSPLTATLDADGGTRMRHGPCLDAPNDTE